MGGSCSSLSRSARPLFGRGREVSLGQGHRGRRGIRAGPSTRRGGGAGWSADSWVGGLGTSHSRTDRRGYGAPERRVPWALPPSPTRSTHSLGQAGKGPDRRHVWGHLGLLGVPFTASAPGPDHPDCSGTEHSRRVYLARVAAPSWGQSEIVCGARTGHQEGVTTMPQILCTYGCSDDLSCALGGRCRLGRAGPGTVARAVNAWPDPHADGLQGG